MIRCQTATARPGCFAWLVDGWGFVLVVSELRRDRRMLRRGLACLLLGVAGVSLAGCASLDSVTGSTGFLSSAQASTAQSRNVQIFIASTRKTSKDADTGEAARNTHFALTSISIPPGHVPGVIERPSFGSDNRSRHFVVSGERRLDPASFQQEVATQVSGRIGTSRDVLVFVHGFNVSYDEARFRLAQVVADGGFAGVPVLFTWPSRNKILAYGSDKESATASRDPLDKLLQDLAATPGVGRVHVLAHSMGTWLAMEALRQEALAGHGDLNGHLGEVMLAAPDIDVDVFRSQMAYVGKSARVSVFASSDDRALSVSRTLAGDRTRLGALDLNNKKHLDELLGLNVRVYDLSNMESGDIFKHGTFAEAPTVVKSIGMQLGEVRATDGPAAAGQAQSFIDPETAAASKVPPPPPAGSVSAAPLPDVAPATN
jgi:esterase/lipase superfamily enzyme